MINEAKYRRQAMQSWQTEREATKQELIRDYIQLREKSAAFLDKISTSLRNLLLSGKTNP